MKKYYLPEPSTWGTILERPLWDLTFLKSTIQDIFIHVRDQGDKALIDYTSKFDGLELNKMSVDQTDIDLSENKISEDLKKAIQIAKNNIELFHKSQILKPSLIETTPGVKCWQECRPIQSVGLYIPGGTAPLFSTVLMLGIPAKIAKCENIIICTPPEKNGEINSAILYAAKLIGIDQIFSIGGAQAIAAMTFGTESIPAVQKIFGPGNQYVMAAKQQAENEGISIDMPAGPSEVLVFADDLASPDFIASDLLSQAEHGQDSHVVLVSTSDTVLDKVIKAIDWQLSLLPRREIAEKALKNAVLIYLDNVETCFDLINEYAPEHLIINSKNALELVEKIKNAGSVFLGPFSPESAGDYASGTNHTLPTNGFAKSFSGITLSSFLKTISFQNISEEGLIDLGPTIQVMAEAEGLVGHSRAVSIRLNGENS